MFSLVNSSFILLISVIIANISVSKCIEPLTAIGLGIAGIASYFGSDLIMDNTYCMLHECCTDKYIKNKLPDFSDLFGQHIAEKHVQHALKFHYTHGKGSQKPLVISFQGTPGIGKNYVATKIVEARYTKGMKSGYVHMFLGRIEFTRVSELHFYKQSLETRIIMALKKCPKSIFVFDEVEKMPAGIFDTIASLLDHNVQVGGTVFNEAIFILISNSGGVEISNALARLMKRGTAREETELHHYESMLEMIAYNTQGGLLQSVSIEKAVIDYFIPFLPLEQRHIVKCIEKTAGRTLTDEVIQKIMHYITFETTHNLFATNGCKKMDKKIQALLYGF